MPTLALCRVWRGWFDDPLAAVVYEGLKIHGLRVVYSSVSSGVFGSFASSALTASTLETCGSALWLVEHTDMTREARDGPD